MKIEYDDWYNPVNTYWFGVFLGTIFGICLGWGCGA